MNYPLFITIIAWVIAVWCVFMTIMCIVSAASYDGSLEETIDKLKGIKRTFPIGNHPLYAVISIAWLIMYYIN